MIIDVRLPIIILLISSPLWGACAQLQPQPPPQPPQQQKLAEITSESEEGFFDLVFSIEELKKLPDGSQVIRSSGIYQGKRVGLEVGLESSWRQASLGADVPLIVYSGRVNYRSLGAESDLLLKAVDHLYGTKQAPQMMRKETSFAAMALEGDPQDLSKGLLKIKLFFDPGAEERYAELYTNIDVRAGKLYINEKDPEYRSAIVQALKSP